MQKYQVGQCVWCRLSEGRFWPAKVNYAMMQISRVLDRNGELGYEVEYFTEKYNRYTWSYADASTCQNTCDLLAGTSNETLLSTT